MLLAGWAILARHQSQDPRDNLSINTWHPITVDAAEVIALANEQRRSIGVSALRESSALSNSATAKCNDMIEADYYEHDGPNGRTPEYFMTAAGYSYGYYGENLAEESWDGTTAKQIVDGWMHSPAHKHALLNPNYVDTGFAVCNDPSNNRAFVVEHFASPR